MQSSPQTTDRSRCSICRAALPPGNAFCAVCGAQVDEMPTEELRGIIYLLSELPRWEALAIIGSEQATALRQRYERRRDELDDTPRPGPQVSGNSHITRVPVDRG